MNRLGNLWRRTAGQLGAAASGLLQQTCPGTQVRDPGRPQAGCCPLPVPGLCCHTMSRCASAGCGRRVCVPAQAEPPVVNACVQRDMVRLRLQRFGVRNNPFYRIVAADARWPRDGKHLELLGSEPCTHALVRSAECAPCFLSCALPPCVPRTSAARPLLCPPGTASARSSLPGAVLALGAFVCILRLLHLRLFARACSQAGLYSPTSRMCCSLAAWRRLVLGVGEASGYARDALRPA